MKVSGTTVGDCLEELVNQFPKFKMLIPFPGVLVNGEYCSPAKPVQSGDDIIIELAGG